ncbi:MAG: cadherin domain-containing protein [Leptolyngbyaceae cyanobacterium]
MGDDTINGGAGADILAGNGGYDQISGGAGADIFFLSQNDGTVGTILDFNPNEDKLVIAPTVGVTSASDLSFDGATGNLSVNGEVIANLAGVSNLDVTDSSIVIQQSLDAVKEDLAIGDVVGSVAVDNPAASNAYQILSVDTGHRFSVDAQGQIINSGVLDYETAPSHTLQVQVTDNLGQTYIKEVLVDVEDVNEAPDLVIDGQSTVASETAAIAQWNLDETAGVVADNQGSLGSAIDGTYDGGVDLNARALSASGDGAAYFDGNNGGIRVASHSGINLSSKTQQTIELWFNADTVEGRQVLYEQGGRYNGFNLYLDGSQLNLGAWAGNRGEWLNQEIEAGRSYHVILTFDNGVLSGYVNGQQIGQVNTGFTTMPAHSGRIGIGHMDNDTRFSNTSEAAGNGYYFNGTIDDAQLYNTALSAAEVNRRYYQTNTLLNALVSERAVAGTVVADVDTIDPEGDTTFFRIVGGNEADIFTINATTGVVTVANPETLDYETETSHTLYVAAIDSAGLVNVAQLDIAVGDENEAPTIGNQIIYVHEPGSQTALGDIIGQVQGFDPNNDQLTYSIADYGADNPWGQSLKVNPTTGELYLDYAPSVIDQDWQALELLANQVTYQAYGDTTQNIVVQVSDGEFTDTATVSLQRPSYLGFFRKTGSDNPFNHYNTTYAGAAVQTKPTFVDIDGDGDLDVFMGVQFAASGNTASQAYLKFYENDGDGNLTDTSLNGTSYNLVTTGNKWLRGGIYALGSSDPSVAFGDVDSDGDVDLLVAMKDGIHYFKNDNNAFRQQNDANNPFSKIGFEGKRTTIALGDIDNDGAVELVAGRNNKRSNKGDPGTLYVYDRPNTQLGRGLGWYTRPTHDFNLVSSRRIGTSDGEREPSPTLVDINYDGTLDIVMGTKDGTLRYYTGDGSNNVSNFAQQKSGDNLFKFVDVGKGATPAIGDLNGDGYLDMAVGSGEGDGDISYFANPPSSGSIVFGFNEKNITEGSGTFSKGINLGGFKKDLTKSTRFGNKNFSVRVFGGAKFALGLEAGFEFTPGKVSASLPFNLLIEAPEKVSVGESISLETTTQLAPDASFTTTTPFIEADVDFDFEFYLGGGIEIDYGVGKFKFDLADQLGTNVNYSLDQSWDSRDANFSYTNQNTYETAKPETSQKKLETPPEKSAKYDEYQKEGSYDVASFDFKSPNLDVAGQYTDGTSLKGTKTSTVLNTTLLLDDIIAGLLESSPEPTMQKIGKYWQEEKSAGPVDIEWNVLDLGLGGEVNVRAKHDLTFDKVTPTLYVENGNNRWKLSNGSYDPLTGGFSGVTIDDVNNDGQFDYRIGYELEGAEFKSKYELVLGDITLDLGLLEGKAKVDLGFFKEKLKFSALSTKIKLGSANLSIPVFETTRSLDSSAFGEAFHYGSIDLG